MSQIGRVKIQFAYIATEIYKQVTENISSANIYNIYIYNTEEQTRNNRFTAKKESHAQQHLTKEFCFMILFLSVISWI